MSHPTDTSIIKQLFQYYADKNIPGFMSLLSPDVIWVEPGDNADIPYSGTFKGLAGIGQMMGLVSHSVQMISFEATEYCANEYTVNAMGYNEAKVIATGKTYKTDWVYSFKLASGKVTHVQVYMDTLTMAKAFKA
ncbi:MAG: hypothetical protein JWQ38_100 [Flavipsychrobacter sp.]|nr:hypothetical protein [Flavipsychrobacter sp.]